MIHLVLKHYPLHEYGLIGHKLTASLCQYNTFPQSLIAQLAFCTLLHEENKNSNPPSFDYKIIYKKYIYHFLFLGISSNVSQMSQHKTLTKAIQKEYKKSIHDSLQNSVTKIENWNFKQKKIFEELFVKKFCLKEQGKTILFPLNLQYRCNVLQKL